MIARSAANITIPRSYDTDVSSASADLKPGYTAGKKEPVSDRKPCNCTKSHCLKLWVCCIIQSADNNTSISGIFYEFQFCMYNSLVQLKNRDKFYTRLAIWKFYRLKYHIFFRDSNLAFFQIVNSHFFIILSINVLTVEELLSYSRSNATHPFPAVSSSTYPGQWLTWKIQREASPMIMPDGCYSTTLPIFRSVLLTATFKILDIANHSKHLLSTD